MTKIISFLLIVLLISCGPTSSNVYETVSKSRWNSKQIEVHFMHQSDIDEKCTSLGGEQGPGNKFGACARTKPNDPSICEIYTAEPVDFDDHNKLETLGHEVWHCLGALHK